MNHRLKLSEVLPSLEKEVENAGKSVKSIRKGSRFSRKRAYALLLLGNYSEVLLILTRISTALSEVGKIQNRLSSEEHEISESQKEALVTRMFDLLSLLRLDVLCTFGPLRLPMYLNIAAQRLIWRS